MEWWSSCLHHLNKFSSSRIKEKMSSRLVNITELQTQLHFQTIWDLVFKRVLSSQKISQSCSQKKCLDLTPIWSQMLWNCSKIWMWNTNISLWSLQHLKHQCQPSNLPFSHHLSKKWKLQLLIFLISTKSSLMKSKDKISLTF